MTEMVDQEGAACKVLVICLGNMDRGDDAIGVAVAKALIDRLPADATLLARSGDMMSLIEDWASFDALVCVDAAALMGTPGRIHRIDLTVDELPTEMSFTSSHAFGLADTVRLARELALAPQDIVVYAVEGGSFDIGAPMTPSAMAAIGEVADRVVGEVDRLRQSRVEAGHHA
jgi:hydrogenase maturation protease